MKTKLTILLLLLAALPAPAATVTFGSPFTILWDDPNPAAVNIVAYTVYEQTAGGPLVAERSAAPLRRVPITPRPLGTHTYVVTATTGGGEETAPSQPVVVEVVPVVPPAPSVPGVVQGLSGVLANGNLTLTWSARPAGEAVTHYTVTEVRPGVPNTVSTVNGTTFISLNISPGPHNFHVLAVNAAGSGFISAPYAVTVIAPPQNVPVAPVNVRFEAR